MTPPALERDFACLEELQALLDLVSLSPADPRRQRLETAFRRGRRRAHLLLTDAGGRRIASVGFNARLEPFRVYCQPIARDHDDGLFAGVPVTVLERGVLEAVAQALKSHGFARFGRPSATLDSQVKIALTEAGLRLGQRLIEAVARLEEKGVLERRVQPGEGSWWLRIIRDERPAARRSP